MSDLNEEQRQEILDAIKSGKKIQAIKSYREYTGQGLKESKEFIDRLTAQLLEQDPDAIQTSKVGCGTTMVAFSILVMLTYVGMVS